MASPAWSPATIASLRRPMPRHFLPRHMTTLLPFQMPLDSQFLHQRSQQALIQELIQVHLRQNFTPPSSQSQSAAAYATPAAATGENDQGLASQEPGISQYQCPECPKKTSTRALLTRHVKSHTRPYKCDFLGCDAATATQRDLDRHQDTHGKIRRYFCPVAGCPWYVAGVRCGFSRRLDNAKRHLKSHINNEGLSVLREDSQGRLSRVRDGY